MTSIQLFPAVLVLLVGCGTLKTPEFRTSSEVPTSTPARKGSKHVAINHQNPRTVATFNVSHVELIWPVKKAQISQKFAPPRNPKHDGIDLRGKINTPIRAAHSGIVVYAGRRYSGYGKMILLSNGAKISTLYAHLNRLRVKTGDAVGRGQTIGLMGRTGRASGVHLHFEVLENKIPVNPLNKLP